MNIKLDLANFRHKNSDNKSTTLEHNKDGHTITLVHSALSKINKEQLMALAKAPKAKEEEPKAMYAEGSPDMVSQADVQPAQEMAPPVDVSAGVPDMQMAPAVPANPNEVRYNELKSMYPNQPDEVILRTIKNESAHNDAQAKEQADKQAAAQAVEQSKVVARNEQELSTIKNKQAMGIPLSGPEQEALAQQQQPAAPQEAAPQGIAPAPQEAAPKVEDKAATDQQSMMDRAYNEGRAGIMGMAAAQQELAKKQADIEAKQLEASDIARTTYQEKYDALETERKAHIQDIQDGYVDPNQYWTGDARGNGGHSKIAAGIGMILAGFNPTNSPNAAINFLQKQMDMNIEAQKANLGAKQNLLSANLRQFGNLKDATDMTRLMQADVLKAQLGQAAAVAQTPMAKAAAQQALSELDLKYAPLAQQFAARRTLSALKQESRTDPSKMEAYFKALDATDPTGKASREARELAIPGLGFANSAEGAKGLREMGTTVNTVASSIDRLKKITKTAGKSMSPQLRAEADTIRSMLIGQLRVPITGPGAMSEGERELLERSVPDVTAFAALDTSTIKRLDTIKAKVMNQYRNQAQINGIDPKVLPVDQSEPQVMTMKGVKYQKVPGGWKKL